MLLATTHLAALVLAPLPLATAPPPVVNTAGGNCTLPPAPQSGKPPSPEWQYAAGCAAGQILQAGMSCKVQCPAGFQQFAGGDDTIVCKCVPGSPCAVSIPTPSLCTLCTKGKYNPTPGATTCVDCPENSGTAGKTPAGALGDCLCDAGWSGVAGSGCTACAANSYKATQSAMTCLPCPAQSETDVTAGPATSLSMCKCAAGYSGTLSTLSDKCLPCDENTFNSKLGQPTCHQCPANSNTATVGAVSRETCQCAQGYTGTVSATRSGTECVACVAGKFKSQLGSAACTTCPADTHTETSDATSEVDCVPDMTSAETIAISAVVSLTMIAMYSFYTMYHKVSQPFPRRADSGSNAGESCRNPPIFIQPVNASIP